MSNAMYPVVIYRLDESEDSFEQGARYRVDDVQSDAFYFRSLKDVSAFLKLHGMASISDKDMTRLRRALRDQDRHSQD